MKRKTYWKELNASQKAALADAVGTSVNYLRQVFIYGRRTGAHRARLLSAETGGVVGAHEFCPGAFSESDRLDIQSDNNAA